VKAFLHTRMGTSILDGGNTGTKRDRARLSKRKRA